MVEGPAEVTFLEALLPRLLPAHSFQVYPHQGRGRLSTDPNKEPAPTQRGLFDNLATTLRVWGRHFDPAVDRVVVLADVDEDDCAELLGRLESLHKKINPRPRTIFRLAIEETEAWYLGDAAAVRKAFPEASRNKLAAWKPDRVGRTWELFQEIIGAQSEDKPGWGEAMGAVLAVDEPLERKNRSPSFRKFCRRVREHAGEPSVSKRPSSTKTQSRRQGTRR